MNDHIYSTKLNIHNINTSVSTFNKDDSLKTSIDSNLRSNELRQQNLRNIDTSLANFENIDPKKNNMNKEFANATTDTILTSGEDVITPQELHSATFEKVNIFPTPVTYALSPPIRGLGLTNFDPTDVNLLNKMGNENDKPSTGIDTDSFAPVNTNIGGEIFIKKRSQREKNYKCLDDALNSEHRIISEFASTKPISFKRIPSLPVLSEDISNLSVDLNTNNHISSDHNIIENTRENYDVKNILAGYSINNFKEKLEWIKLSQIGEGNFSIVNLYKLISNENRLDYNKNSDALKKLKFVAVKDIIYRNSLLFSDTDQENVKLTNFESALTRELSVLQMLDHPCVISLYGINDPVFLNDKTPLTNFLKNQSNANAKLPVCNIIMPYCPGGDLLNAMSQVGGNLSFVLIQRLFTELTMAVKYLHDNSIIHRDLKLENILLNYSLIQIQEMFYNLELIDDQDKREALEKFLETNSLIKLTDFGLCKRVDKNEMCSARCGSEDYVSPEILIGIPYDGHLSDTWALGVILYCLLEDRLPFDPPKNATIRQRKKATSYRIVSYEWKWYNYQTSDKNCKLVVENTLTRRDQRWDINKIIEFPFVQDCLKTLSFS